ncbi:MAG TPA: cupin domain-containing protein [Rhodopila sp.]
MLQRRGFVSCAICSAIGLAAASVSANAQGQPPGFSRKILQKTEYPGDKYVCILMEVDIEPNALVARHTHPGVESGYLVSGSSTLSVKGQPDRVLKPGDGYQVPPETPHSVRNGPGKSVVSATFIVEKDKPLATPAPE